VEKISITYNPSNIKKFSDITIALLIIMMSRTWISLVLGTNVFFLTVSFFTPAYMSSGGYSVTVSIGSHPLGNEWSYIWVETEDGYRDNIRLATAGNPSYTFDIHPGYGDSIRVCASSAIVAPSNCRTFSAGEDIDVELDVEGLLD
jgi:hypothetical protein